MEFNFLGVREIFSRFSSKVNDWTELWDVDKEGDPLYPRRGMPESRYNPEGEDLSKKTSHIEDVLISTRDVLAWLIVSLPAPDQVFMICILYQNLLPKLFIAGLEQDCIPGCCFLCVIIKGTFLCLLLNLPYDTGLDISYGDSTCLFLHNFSYMLTEIDYV